MDDLQESEKLPETYESMSFREWSPPNISDKLLVANTEWPKQSAKNWRNL